MEITYRIFNDMIQFQTIIIFLIHLFFYCRLSNKIDKVLNK